MESTNGSVSSGSPGFVAMTPTRSTAVPARPFGLADFTANVFLPYVGQMFQWERPQPYVGEIRMFAGNFAPEGWMLCPGAVATHFRIRHVV